MVVFSVLCHNNCPAVHQIKVKVKLDECLVGMVVDTGAAVSLTYETTFRELWATRDFHPSHVASKPNPRCQFLLWDAAM